MGGFLGIGGSGSNTDRKQQIAGYGDLSNIFNTGLDTGKSNVAQGTSDLGQSAGYDSKLLNGDRSTILQAISPEVSSITGQADAARRQQAALGTSRGGGTNANNQQIQQREQGAISNAVGGVQPQAAQSLAGIGGTEAGLGANLLGLGNNAAGNLTGDAINSYKTTSAQNGAAGAALGQIASGLIFGL